MKHWILILILGWPLSATANDLCIGSSDTMACNLTTISWVEVSFKGDLLKEYKSEFERLIRLRLRNDLSMLKYEVRPFAGNWSQVEKPEFKERGQMLCNIWTVENGSIAAAHIRCKLSGYGYYRGSRFNEFEKQALASGLSEKMKETAEKGLRMIITEISSDLLEAKDIYKREK